MMQRSWLVAAVLVSSLGVPAHAAPPLQPTGRKCAFNSVTDVSAEAGWQVGDLRAGPLVTFEDGTLECSIHVNNDSHNGTAAATETFTAVGGVVVGEPRPLRYRATAADDVSLCTAWHGASGTLYWVSPPPGEPYDLGHWDTSAWSSCNPLGNPEGDHLECRLWNSIDNHLGTNIAKVWQDCEPYPPLF